MPFGNEYQFEETVVGAFSVDELEKIASEQEMMFKERELKCALKLGRGQFGVRW